MILAGRCLSSNVTTQDLHDDGGAGKEFGAEDKWQRHVVVAIAVVVAILVAVTACLIYAEAHGFFRPSSGQTPPVSPWPDSLP
jgi:hypothetical protein